MNASNVTAAMVSTLALNASNVTAATVSTLTLNASNIIMTSLITDAINTSTLTISTIYGSPNPLIRFNINTSSISINSLPSQAARATVDVNGVVYAEKFVMTSDRRLKSDLKIIEPPTVIPSAYRYVLTETGESDIGMIADEIEPIAPECIYTRPDGYKAVNYMKLVPVCLSLIKSLMERMEALERDR